MKKEKVFIIVFLVIIYGALGWIVLKQGLISLHIIDMGRTDNWTVYEAKPESNIIDKIDNKIGSLKTSIENRANTYFPFYSGINELYQGVNYATNALLYKNVPIKTNWEDEYLFYDKVNKFYYYETPYTTNELDERLDKQLAFFNDLADKGLDVSIYLPTRYELTTLKKNNLNCYIDTFENKLDKRIKLSKMNIDSIDKYKDIFYTTDHHWNAYGAIEGYNAIMDMLGATKIDNLTVKKQDHKYYGSMAKTAMNTTIENNILDIDIRLDYDVLVNGEKPDKLFKPREIAKGKSDKFYDYYIQYFNGQYGNVVYDYHQEDKENLLIMSDSYVWQIDYLIASSFNKTHVINLLYDEYKNNEFDLTTYIKENNIDKVLFVYEGESILFDEYNYNFEGRVK